MDFKPDLEQALKRLDAFWNRDTTDRACISVKAPMIRGMNVSPFINEHDFKGDTAALVDYWTNPETILKNRLHQFEHTFFGGEALPAIFQNYGTSGHCNYYGAKPTYGQNTIWFEPVLSDLEPHSFLFRQDVLDQHLAITEYLTQNAKGRYFVGMPDSCGTIDAICHLYGSENVLFAFAEQSEELLQAIHTVNVGWKDSCEQFYQATHSNCNGSVHAWMDLWAPGRVMQMQCDLSVMISPSMYEEFVLPELEEQIQWIDYPVYHLDGMEQIKHLDSILSLKKLKAIQWTYVAGQPSAGHFIEPLQRIQQAGKNLIIMAPKEDLPVLLENLSSTGLYLHCEAEDSQEAQEIIRCVQMNSRK
ncbi:MAG: trimethylamine corrinoid protein 2 [Ruthenibacterium sp.]